MFSSKTKRFALLPIELVLCEEYYRRNISHVCVNNITNCVATFTRQYYALIFIIVEHPWEIPNNALEDTD